MSGSNPTFVPSTSGPVRRVVHALIAALGWIVFARFWWLVFYKTPPAEAVRGVLILGLLLLFAVTATLGWIRHNIRLFRNRSRRRTPPFVRPDFGHDVVGRTITAPAWEEVRLAPEVEIAIAGSVKTYRIF